MTPSSIRPIRPIRPARRTTLLAASALCGVATMLAQPALAGTLPGIPSAANITVSTGGSQPVISFPDAITLQIDLNAPRTVINWSALHVSSGDTMDFLFDAASDIVLNKTTSQIQIDNGATITGKVGVATGGNIWFYSPQGVIVSPGATMSAGGFVFSKGSGLVDATFVDSTAPLNFLRSAADALIQMSTVSAATSASVNSTGDVVLSATSGALSVQTAYGKTVSISTTSGSITASEVTATTGAASVAAGGPGATVTQISGATGVTVSSNNNSSVGAATTTTSGDILITSNGSASLTLGNSARDLTLSAPQVFVSTVDAARDVFITGTTSAYVTNRIFAGDDIEITADGDVTAGGAYLKSTGVDATDDAHILLKSTNGFVNAGNTLLTQGTGAQAGDITIQAATTATLGTASSTRDIKVSGVTASLSNGSAARDVFVTATTGNASVITAATAGDDVEVTTTDGAVSASGATLKSTGVGAVDDAHVLARSTNGAVNVGAAVTQGTGVTAGDVTFDAGGTINSASMEATRDVKAIAAGTVDVSAATAGRDITVTSNGGDATLGAAVLTGSGSGDDLAVTASGNAVLGDVDYTAITSANVFSRTGGGTGMAVVKSVGGGDAMVHLDTSAKIDTLEGVNLDVTVASGDAEFGTMTADGGDIYAETYDGGLTVGTATANNGDVELYVAGGDLTITGSAHGANLVHLETDGLLDGTAATLISSDGDIELIGGSVDVGHIRADATIQATAVDTDALVQWAEAGQTVVVASLNGDATLRGATGPDGVAVIAYNTATFGADDLASITPDNYVDTNVSCGCGTDGLQVTSYNGDAVVNINSATNGIDLVGSSIGGNVTVAQTAGDLKINEVAGYNITLTANDGTLEVGHVVSSGGDYTVTGHDFLAAALTPDLFFGTIHDVTITDTLGDLDLGTLSLHADRRLTITASNGTVNGAVKGAAQLSAGSGLNDGRITVTGEGIALDTVTSDGSVMLDGGNGLVDVATSVDVWGNYTLRGGDFANAALTPQGAMVGTWNITDRAGGFDFTGKTLHYGGSLNLFVDGVVNGGDITVDTGGIYALADSGHLGSLTAATSATAFSADDLDVDLIQAGTLALVQADTGTARLGAAIMTGTGTTQVQVLADDGDAVLGAATPGAITTANVITSTGTTSTVTVSAVGGRADINLDHITGTSLTSVSADDAAKIKVANGALTIVGLTAGADSEVLGSGYTNVVTADVTGDLAISSANGDIMLGLVGLGARVKATGTVSLDAAGSIAQDGYVEADRLDAQAGTGITLLGDNDVDHLGTISVAIGGFAFKNYWALDLDGPITATGQTVDLRSNYGISQASTGIITAQKLTGSSSGGAVFGAANQLSQLGNFTNTGGGLLKLVNGGPLTIGGTVLSAGGVALTSHAGMTIASAGTVTANGTGDAIVLASDGTFTNTRGADAVTATNAGGRWLIYTQAMGNPSGSTAANSFNGLAGKSFYGSAYNFSTEAFAVTPNAGNRFVYAYQPTLTVTPVSQTVTYDGLVPTPSAAITGLVNGDLAADAWTGAASVSGAVSKNVGTYGLTAGAGTLASDLNYAFAYGTGSLRIDPKVITGALTADDKTYDGTDTAVGLIGLTGVVSGDAVSASGAYAFDDKTAAIGKTVTASGVTLSGGDAGNYTLGAVSTGTADIFKKTITGALTANDKTYDGGLATTGSIGLTGVVAGDTVTASGVYAFADKNAGAGKTVTVSGAVLAGLDAANYDLGGVSGDLADILRRSVTVAADDTFKTQGRFDPPLAYRITVGDLVAGDAFTGGLVRGAGEAPGDYAITQGTLGLSTNYDLTFTGAVFRIDPLPSNDQAGTPVLKHLNASPDFTLDWDPQPNLETQGPTCSGEGCPTQAAVSGGAQEVAALR